MRAVKTRAFGRGIVSGCLIGTAFLFCHRDTTDLRSKLLQDYGAAPDRPIALRLWGFPYCPESLRRGGDNEGANSRLQNLKITAYSILAEPRANPADVEKQRTHVAALLIAGKIDDAITTIEASLAVAAESASLWNDYSVALYERARAEDDPRSLATALAAADRALELDAATSEALFNRAAVLQRLSLDGAAHEAWRQYLNIETDAAWAEEAHRGARQTSARTALQRWKEMQDPLESAATNGEFAKVDRIVAAFPQQVRRWAEAECLVRWADQWTRGERRAARQTLEMTQTIANRLAAFRGEGLLKAAVAAIDRAVQSSDQRVANELAEAQITYDRARRLIAARKPSEAAGLLSEAERKFTRSGTPMALLARCYRAGVSFDARDAIAARAMLDSVESDLDPSFKALRGEVHWERARIAGRLGETYAALEKATAAAEAFSSIGERDNAARNRSEIASMLSTLGRPHDAWRIRHQVLRDASSSGAPSVLATALYETANDETSEGRLDVARSFFDVLLAGPLPSPLLEFNGRLWRLFIGVRLGERSDPQSVIALLESAATRIEDAALREDALDQLRFAEALLIAPTNRDRALRLLQECIAFREKAGRLSRAADAYDQRGRLHRDAGDIERAERDFERVMETLESQRETVLSSDLRDSFFSAADQACDELISIHADANDAAKVFETAERCRARNILDAVSGSRIAEPLPLREVQRRLPRDVVLIHYMPLRDRLITVVVTSTAATLRTSPVAMARIESARAAIVRALDFDDPALMRRHAQGLHAMLIAPVSSLLDRSRMIIVAPPSLMAIPFAALEDGRGQFLVKRYEIAFAPSAAAFVKRNASLPRPVEKALIVGDPAFSHVAGIEMTRLPSAAAEAYAIGAIYKHAVVLTSDAATRQAVAEEALDSDLIHIASHAIVNARSATQSALLLASAPGDDGVLQLPAMSRLALRKNPLVILAGCRTGSFGGGRGSIRSLAFAFLAAGSRGVVASLWDVEDAPTQYFSERFHQRLRRGVPTATALRETQIELMTSGDSKARRVSTWSAFQLYAVE